VLSNRSYVDIDSVKIKGGRKVAKGDKLRGLKGDFFNKEPKLLPW